MKVAINNLICIIRTAAPSGAAGFASIRKPPSEREGDRDSGGRSPRVRKQSTRVMASIIQSYIFSPKSQKSSHFTLTRLSKKGII